MRDICDMQKRRDLGSASGKKRGGGRQGAPAFAQVEFTCAGRSRRRKPQPITGVLSGRRARGTLIPAMQEKQGTPMVSVDSCLFIFC